MAERHEQDEAATRRRNLALALDRVVSRGEFHHEAFSAADAAPRQMVAELWPWLVERVGAIAAQQHPYRVSYRDDPVTALALTRASVVQAVVDSVVRAAETSPKDFLGFVREYEGSDLLFVHRAIARALERIAPAYPGVVVRYLVADPRRLVLGDFLDSARESKQLIKAVAEHASADQLRLLEASVLGFSIYRTQPEGAAAAERRRRLRYDREHRLRLLRAFPAGSLRPEVLRLREREERALPEARDDDARLFGGAIGPRMTLEELIRARNEDVVNLIRETPDDTEAKAPGKAWLSDYSRAGGADELSQAVGELAKREPARGLEILNALQPQQYEKYASRIVEALAYGDEFAPLLPQMIDRLVESGFGSQEFREAAADALTNVAVRAKGLPEKSVGLLMTWLEADPEPNWSEDPESPILAEREEPGLFVFGHPPLIRAMRGRGRYLRALAAGFLMADPPRIEMWARLVEERLDKEQHPWVWGETLYHMPVLFTGNALRATHLYDRVLRRHPAALAHAMTIHAIAAVLGRLQSREVAWEWLEMVRDVGTRQASIVYGELLGLYNFHLNDDRSGQRIREVMERSESTDAVHGLVAAASVLWHEQPSSDVLTAVLVSGVGHDVTLLGGMYDRFFRAASDDPILTPGLRHVIQAVASREELLGSTAESLVELVEPLVASDPDLVAQVTEQVVEMALRNRERYSGKLVFVDDALTNIALTLHRQERHRAVGLRLLEGLMALSLRETRAALEALDRVPARSTQAGPSRPRRRRRLADATR